MKSLNIPRCPNCGQQPSSLVEVANAEIIWPLNEDGSIAVDDSTQRPGSISGVIAVCDCKYQWRVRRAKTIDDFAAMQAVR